MEPKRALAWFLGVALVALAAQWVPVAGALGLALLIPVGLIISGALALVTLVPAAFDHGPRWTARTAALLPGAVLGFAAEQLEEALVTGGAEASLAPAVALGLFAVAATAWLAYRSGTHHRVWLGIGLVLGGVLAYASLDRFGWAMFVTQLLMLATLIGVVTSWLQSVRSRPVTDETDAEPASGAS